MINTIKYSRTENITSATGNTEFDICIIGGGIHGACVARLAAEGGLSTFLIEKTDYAAETSSRSSKMAHGGLRYLEMFDFQQVFEGIKARENLFRDFPDFVKPYNFLIPINRGAYFDRFKMHIGLFLYDLMVSNKDRKHKWIKRENLNFEGFDANRKDLDGCFCYTDGVLSDSRLVLENILRAREAGAIALNHAKVTSVSDAKLGINEISWEDQLSKKAYVSKARFVINCAGPWSPFIEHSSLKTGNFKARYSQGTHILFNKMWTGPALFLPMPGKARYYFVWPHFSGTMVGTTEREVDELVDDPQPEQSEIDEILTRIEKDLPNSGLNKNTMHYAFAGVRTLPLRANQHETGRISRKHIWHSENGMLSLIGGKLTTAEWTASEALKFAQKYLNKKLLKSNYVASLNSVSTYLKDFNLSDSNQNQLIRRFSSRAINVIQNDEDAQIISPYLLKGELRYAQEIEQAETLDDLLRRRLELEYLPGAGLEYLSSIITNLKSDDSNQLALQEEVYRERIAKIYKLLNK